ncbi:MAG: type II toxin-antitoxin system Phd/YefM family antitoxin [Planctomycetota bacterium]
MVIKSLFDTKTHLSALIHAVERDGETVVITRHGKPVAQIVPYRQSTDARAEALATLRQRAREEGIVLDPVEAVAPLPEDVWGAFAEAPTRVAEDAE